MKELLLRPYNGRIFLVRSKKAYEKAHKKLFKRADPLENHKRGRASGEEDKNGQRLYLVFAKDQHVLAHELSHVLLHVFALCEIDPRDSNGEPFCYMLSQLILDANA